MQAEVLLGFIAAGIALAGSPGPATLSIAAAGAAFGARRGARYMVGVFTGMIVVMAVTATGVTSLVLALPGAKPVVSAVAAAYFVYLAIRIATAPPLAEDAGAGQPSFVAGIFLSFVNPKGYAAMAAMYSGFVLLPERPVVDTLVKTAILMAVMISVHSAWLFAGAAMTRFFHQPGPNRVINIIFAVLLIVSVGMTFLI